MIKKIIPTAFIFVFLCSNCFSQSYGHFEWDAISLGSAIPAGDQGLKAGLSYSTEPRYNINDFTSIGLRLETAFYISDLLEEDEKFGISFSSALIGDYYIKNRENKRLFVGLGLGRFSTSSEKTVVDGIEQLSESQTSFGLIPRIGYELGLLRIVVEYNYILNQEVTSYIGIKLGLSLWGKDIG